MREEGNVRIPTVKLLITIVDREQGKNANRFFKEHRTRFTYVAAGQGTASSEVLDVLGLGGIEKSLILTVMPDFWTEEMLYALDKDFGLCRKGMGIAFTIPLSGVCASVGNSFSKETQEFVERRTDHMDQILENTKSEITHDLIVAVINQGNSDDLMDAAKEAGATGGTIIPARHTGGEEVSKFFGISVQPEKEIVAILTPREDKKKVMKAISSRCGMQTEAKGIVFALPVDGVAGINSCD